MDEHRIGLKPILRKVWSLDKERPLAPVQHRYEWRYLVGFVHPTSGRTIFHLATSVSVPLFEAELAAFAQAVGASPTKQIVLVLDRARWHSTQRLRVPDHLHLLFVPPLYSKVSFSLPGREAKGGRRAEGRWGKAMPPLRCDRFE